MVWGGDTDDFGHGQAVQTKLVPGDPKLFALLPYEVKAVQVTPRAAKFRPGTTATFRAAIQTGAEKPAGSHCLRVELVGPDGKVVKHWPAVRKAAEHPDRVLAFLTEGDA